MVSAGGAIRRALGEEAGWTNRRWAAELHQVMTRTTWEKDGLEIALKGGQMGDVHFFETARLGRT